MRWPSMAIAPRSTVSSLGFMVTMRTLRIKVFMAASLQKQRGHGMPCPRIPGQSLQTSPARRRLHESHFPPPVFRLLEKLDDLAARFFAEITFAQAGVEHVVPVGEHVQLDAVPGEIDLALVLVQAI